MTFPTRPMLFLLLICGQLASANASGQEKPATESPSISALKADIEADAARLVELYKDLHRNPELSNQEVRTAGVLAAQLKESGFDVTENFGGTGIVGVLKQGAGPTILVRTDMDALPISERTGLDYSSKVQVRDKAGQLVGVMHACGHDMHMTCWSGLSRLLSKHKDKWNGTLIFIGQPAEERGSGARDMLAAGLFKQFPKPDFCLALHCEAFVPTGSMAYTVGPALANVDSVDVTVLGKGGHGAAPHTTVDPVVIAARIVLDLQTLVSREIDPIDSAVVTVGSIHGGTKHNIIPSEVHLQITVRSFKDSTRAHLLKGIERIARHVAASANAPEPIVKVDENEFTPVLVNDEKLTVKLVALLKDTLGSGKVVTLPPIMGGEDFSRYGREGVPITMFRLGTVKPDVFERVRAGAGTLPSLHSDKYAPEIDTTIRTGILSLATCVLDLAKVK